MKKLAFVVATKDRPADLYKMLQSLLAQSHRPDQIVVVDSSTEPANKVTGAFPELNIVYIHHKRPSASAQRNIGIKAVDQHIDLIGFLDDDVVLDPSAIEAVLRFWKEAPHNVGGCALNLKNFEPTGSEGLKYSSLAQRLGLYSNEKGIVTQSGWQTMIGTITENSFFQWLPSTASVWKKEIFERFRFDEYFDGYSYLEDLDFSLSVGRDYGLIVIADARFYHYSSSSGRISGYRFGKVEVRNRLYIVRKHGLSLPRCFAGIFVRFLMTLSASFRNPSISNFQRALGNCVGVCQFLFSRKI